MLLQAGYGGGGIYALCRGCGVKVGSNRAYAPLLAVFVVKVGGTFTGLLSSVISFENNILGERGVLITPPLSGAPIE